MSKKINTILNLKDNFSKTVQKTTQNTKKFQRQIQLAEKQAKNMRKAVTGAFTSTAAKIGGAIAAIGVAKFANDSLMLASNLQEVQNVVDTTFGKMSGGINKFADNAGKQFGISALQAKKYSGTLGAMLKSSGISADGLSKMSSDLAGLAGDLASFYNLEPDEAFEKLKSAMVGSTEPMLALGINMSVASMEAYAMEKGIRKSWKTMSEAEKQTLRYEYLIEKTADAQGDYAKTSKGFANGLRTMQLRIKDVGAQIMSYAIPSFEMLFQNVIALTDGIDVDAFMKPITSIVKQGFEKLSKAVAWVKDNMNWLIPVATGLVGAITSFSVITSVVAGFIKLKKATEGFTKASALLNGTLLANPIFWVAAAIGALVAIFALAYKNSDTFRAKVNGLWGKFKEFASGLKGFVVPLLRQLSGWFQSQIMPNLLKLGALIQFIWGKLKPLVAWLVDKLIGGLSVGFSALKNIAGFAFGGIKQYIEGAMTTFGGLLNFITGVFTGDWGKAWEGIKQIFSGIFQSFGPLIKTPINLIIGGLNLLIRGFNKFASFKMPEWLPEGLGGGKTIGLSIPEIPKFALGTQYFKGGMARINERGGEIVDLPNGSKVIPADKSKQMIGKGLTVHITVQGNMIGNKEYADYLGSVIWSKIKPALDNM